MPERLGTTKSAVYKYTYLYLLRHRYPISMKFGRLKQNNIPIMQMWSISKPEVEF